MQKGAAFFDSWGVLKFPASDGPAPKLGVCRSFSLAKLSPDEISAPPVSIRIERTTPAALIPKIPFSFLADFWVWVTSEARGSVSVGFWGSCQLSPFWGGVGVRPEGSIAPPPRKRKPSLPCACTYKHRHTHTHARARGPRTQKLWFH